MRKVGPYQLVTRLASGTLGDVFLGHADAPEPNARWAIKVIRPKLADDLRIARLIQTEGQTAIRFRHPSIVAVHEVDRPVAELFIRSELVGGQPLSNVLKKLRVEDAPLDHRLVCHIGAEVAAGLGAAHEGPWFPGAPGRFVLGTLAPRRVFLTYDGRVKVLGLGFGRARLTQPLNLATLAYASPEVIAEREPAPRSDIFSLGVLLYYAFSGRQIFRRADEASTRAAIREANAPILNSRTLKVDPEVGDLIAEMMAPRMEARPESLQVVEEKLRASAVDASDQLTTQLSEVMRGAFADELEGFKRMTDAATRQKERVSNPRAAPLETIAGEGELAGAPQKEQSPASSPPAGDAAASETSEAAPEPKAEPRAPRSRDESRLREVQRAEWSTGDLDQEEEGETERITEPDRTSPLKKQPRRRFARYVLERTLSRSNVASIHLCRDPNIARTVMVKVLDPELVTDPRLSRSDWVRLFKTEARIAGRLEHEGFPVLFDAGRDSGAYFMAFEAIDGRTLSEHLDGGGALDQQRIRRLVVDLASALAHLHDLGWVHGDLKPSNVLLTGQRRAKLVDLSLASPVDNVQHPLLRTNLVSATPELLRGERYSPRSEQFALGTLLYQLLVGTRPFRGLDDAELATAIETFSPTPPQTLNPDVDPTLSEVCMRLLEKDEAARFENMRAVAARLEDVGSEPPRPSPASRRIGVERDTDPIMAAPDPSDLAPVLLVDPALWGPLGHRLFDGRRRSVALYDRLEEAFERLERAPARLLVVSREVVTDEAALRSRLERLSPRPELRIVPPAAERVLGAAIDPVGLSESLIGICERVTTLTLQDFGHRATSDAPATARSVARRIGLDAAAQMQAALAVALRDLADRLRLSVGSEEMRAIIPPQLLPLFAEIEASGPEGRPDRPGPTAQVVAVVEDYFRATRPRDGSPRVSPRRAVLALRDRTDAPYGDEAVEALIEHLREAISALDLSPATPDAPRILLAGIERNDALLHALEFDGFSIEEADDGHAAWEKLRKEAYSAAIVDAALPGRDGLSLVKLCRAHPDTAQVAFLIVGGEGLGADLGALGDVEVVARSSALDSIRAQVGRLMRS